MSRRRARDVVNDDTLPFEPQCPCCGQPTPRLLGLWCVHIDADLDGIIQTCTDCCRRWHPNSCPDCGGHGFFMLTGTRDYTVTCATCDGSGRIHEPTSHKEDQ